MKLLSLNTYGARQGQIFFDYVSKFASHTDIFCFQEVYSAVLGAPKEVSGCHLFGHEELRGILPNFVGYFDSKSFGFADDGQTPTEWLTNHGTSIFVRKNLSAVSYSALAISDSLKAGAPPVEGLVKAQILSLEVKSGLLHVINTHGMSRPGDKLDTTERLNQSRRLLEIISSLPKGKIVLCGDFNLMPHTESIKMLGAAMKDLIKEFKIENTRNEISWKIYNDKQSFADFTFVSEDIKIKSFEVPYNLVSDHLPMILEFEA